MQNRTVSILEECAGEAIPMTIGPDTANAFGTEHLQTDLRGRSIRGGILTLTSQGAQFLMQSVATIVLARLLVPADFGLVAMVTAITGLGQSFADLGLSEATIQRPQIEHKQVSTLFWINAGIGLGLMLITISLAPALAWFYHEPRLRGIALVSSLTFLVGGLRVQHDALLKRQMRYPSIAIRDITAYCTAVPLAIYLAWRGAGYWAIVALPLTLNVVSMLFSWGMIRWIPGLPSLGNGARSMVSFGGKVAASSLLLNAMRNTDNVLVGWYWGAGPLGLYSRAYNLLLLPVRQLSAPAAGVIVPALSRLQDAPERLARYYLRGINLIMWISAPLFGYLFAAATPVIVLTLGNRWREAAPVFQFLAIFALGQLLIEATFWLLVSRGESSRLLRITLAMSPVIVASYAIGLPFGIKGVALAGSIVQLAIFPAVIKASFRGTSLTLKGLGHAIVWPLFISLLGGATSVVAGELLLPKTMPSQLGLPAACFALSFLVAMFIPAVRNEVKSIAGVVHSSALQRWAMPTGEVG
jgi:O-antigen/teichoic acid export membrane protein